MSERDRRCSTPRRSGAQAGGERRPHGAGTYFLLPRRQRRRPLLGRRGLRTQDGARHLEPLSGVCSCPRRTGHGKRAPGLKVSRWRNTPNDTLTIERPDARCAVGWRVSEMLTTSRVPEQIVPSTRLSPVFLKSPWWSVAARLPTKQVISKTTRSRAQAGTPGAGRQVPSTGGRGSRGLACHLGTFPRPAVTGEGQPVRLPDPHGHLASSSILLGSAAILSATQRGFNITA